MDIRPNIVRESIEAVDGMRNILNENTAAVLKRLLNEKTTADIADPDDEGQKGESEGVKDIVPTGTDNKPNNQTDEKPKDKEPEMKEDWSDVEKYKVGNTQYDLTNASDEEVVNVFKKLKDNDKVKIVTDDDQIDIKDNETGAEYIVQVGTQNPEGGAKDTKTENKKTTMQQNDKKLFEVAMGEFTNAYQKKDAMTTPPNTEPAAPGKTRQMTNGLPTGSNRPYGNKVPKAVPFTEGEELAGQMLENENQPVEEAAQTVSTQPQAKATKTAMHREGHRNVTKVASKGGEYKGTLSVTEEQMVKIGKIVEENKSLKKELADLQKTLTEAKQTIQEAIATNAGTMMALRLISENTTTEAEKKEITTKMRSVKTVDEAKNLYESFTRELKKTPQTTMVEGIKADINSKNVIEENKETQVKASESLDAIRSLMHRVC